MVDDGTFRDGREPDDTSGRVFQPVWWHRGWVPFAEDGGGNLVQVSMSMAKILARR
jgi:cell wall assembly regulator SMI1